ncbi:MAG: PAS domain S-box protein [Desulfobacteraceae bacterium]|nr:PAS domain S-box protein [Pseudomonadota bacterium]MCG2757314.1 PAS domain S-box protein [Desulfobacteraceae bacterium]
MKLTSKLAVLFVLLSIVPLSLVSYLSYENHRQTIEQETINRLVSTTILKEAAVNRLVEDAKRSIRELARRPLIREYAAVLVSRGPADPEYRAAQRSIRDEHLNPTLEEERSLLKLFILRGSDGLILVSSDEKQEGRYRESEPYFVEGKDRTCVQNVYYSLPLGKAVMTIGAPIKDKEGKLIAVLAGHVDLAEMSEIMMQRSGLSATEKTYAVNKFNFFVTDPGLEPGSALKKAVYTDGVKAGLKHQNGVGFYNDYRGVPVIGAYRWMPERELVILAEVDQAEAFAPILALRKARLWISAAVSAIVALLGLLFARTITRPVLQLVRGAEEVGRGNLEYRIEVVGRNEIGQLATAFNEMTADLHRSLGALRESETRYRNLTESLEELIYRADPETFGTTYVNRAVEGIYGYTVEEFLGDPTIWESTIHPEDKKRVFAWFTEAQRKIESGAVEYRIIRKDKILRWVEDHASWEKDQRGNVVSLNGVMYDITERKRAEEKTKQLQEYLQLQIDRMPIGLIVWDTEFRVTSWNPAAEKIFGFTAQEALGKHPYGLIVPKEAQPHVDDIWRRLLEGDITAHSINDNMTKDGRTIICQWSNTPLKETDDTVRGVLSMVQDITKRRRAEEDLQAAYGQSIIYAQELKEQIEKRERMEEEKKKAEAQLYQAQKMEAIGTLTGGIAHDFNNLLTAILGNAQLALMKVIKDESLRKQIEEINKAGERAASLTRQLLAFSRKQVIQPKILDVNEAINETEKMLKRMIGEDIEFLLVLEPELWKIHADPGQIDQVFMNLVVNARDAMPSGGKLTIETANVELDEAYFRKHGIEGEKSGHYAMLAVSDTGCGMDEKIKEHIFDPFFTTKGVGKGTGLGLSTVYGIVKQNKGYVWVHSEPGKGTTFNIYFPRVTEGVAAGKEQEKFTGEISGSETVLIVEDNDGVRKLAQEILLLHGYKGLVAENGEDALRVSHAHEGPIHLMIIDVVMPGMSGTDLAEKLQSIRPEARVLYMSGYTDNAIVEHGFLAPGLNFLQKPFTLESLGKKVRQVLDAEKK